MVVHNINNHKKEKKIYVKSMHYMVQEDMFKEITCYS